MTTKTKTLKNTDWVIRGYNDNKNKTLYKNAPSDNPPEVPDHMLPENWRYYFKGFYAGNQDTIKRILKSLD